MNVLGDRVLELGPKPDDAGSYKNFKLTRDADGVAWLLFDREGTSANTLSADLIEELDKVLAEPGRPPPHRPRHPFRQKVRLHCRRRRQCVSRRDRFQRRRDRDRPRACGDRPARGPAGSERRRDPRLLPRRRPRSGAGLPDADCDRGRAVSFPEVMLGLHPGLGGTVRFTQLVNPMQAMPLMLTGKTIDARKAKSLGLVDAVTQERHVRNAVKDAVSGRLKRARPGLLTTISVSARSAASSPDGCAERPPRPRRRRTTPRPTR